MSERLTLTDEQVASAFHVVNALNNALPMATTKAECVLVLLTTALLHAGCSMASGLSIDTAIEYLRNAWPLMAESIRMGATDERN